MTSEEIGRRLIDAGFPVTCQAGSPDSPLQIPPEALLSAAQMLRDDPDLSFDSLMCLSGLDWPAPTSATADQAPDEADSGELEVVYHLFSFRHRHYVTLKVRCSKAHPEIPSVAFLWPTANWHEREAYDLVGVRFTNHPDLRRILLPEDWEGHPLRKDYEPPEFWHDIPVTTQIETHTDEGN